MTVSRYPTTRSLRLKWQPLLKSYKKITDKDIEIYNQDIKYLKQMQS